MKTIGIKMWLKNKGLVVVFLLNINLIYGCKMASNNSVINIVKKFETSSSVTTSQVEVITRSYLKEDKKSDAFDDFLGGVTSGYKIYNGENIQSDLGIASLKVTEKIGKSNNFITYLEIELNNHLSIDEVKNVWGQDYKLIVNRPVLPVGDRCVAQYLTATTKLDFGFSDCEKMDNVMKISVTKITSTEF